MRTAHTYIAYIRKEASPRGEEGDDNLTFEILYEYFALLNLAQQKLESGQLIVPTQRLRLVKTSDS